MYSCPEPWQEAEEHYRKQEADFKKRDILKRQRAGGAEKAGRYEVAGMYFREDGAIASAAVLNDSEYIAGKQRLCDMLLPVLQETRALYDLENLRYVASNQTVRAMFQNGCVKEVNVEGDSGTAMIKDIVAGLA